MNMRWIAAAAWVIGMQAAALAQDDVEFARGLVRRGYFDLADEVLKRCASDPASSFVKAEMQLAKAELETDLAKQKEFIDGSIKLLEDFRSRNSGHALAFEALLNIGWLRSRKAQLIADAMKIEQTPEQKDKLLKEAKVLYGDVEKFYADNIDKWKKMDKRSPEIENALMDARLELPKTQLDHAGLPGMSGDEKKSLLSAKEGSGGAVAILIDFEFDYGDRPMAFEAFGIEGRCYTELEDYKTAEQKLKLSISLRQRLAEAHMPPNDYHWGVIKNGYLYLAHCYNRWGKAKDALATIDRAFSNPEMKSLATEGIGLGMKIEKAKALAELNQSPAASDLLQAVAKADPNGKWGALAKETMTLLTGGIGSGPKKMNPADVYTSAESFYEKQNYTATIQALRKCIESCSTQADKDKYIPESWYRIGDCLFKMNRLYEAAYAFEQVYVSYQKHERAPKSIYLAVFCYKTEYDMSGDPRDKSRTDELMTKARSIFGDRPEIKNFVIFQAREALQLAQDSYRIKKLDEAISAWETAAPLFDQIPSDAEAYEEAQYQSAYCWVQAGATRFGKNKKDSAVKVNFDKAEKTLTDLLKRPDPSKNEAQKRERADVMMGANQLLVRILTHDVNPGRTSEAMERLDNMDKALPAEDPKHDKIWSLKIQCYLSLKKVDEAVAVTELMFSKYPDGAPIAQACKSVAIALHDVTEGLMDRQEEKELREKAKTGDKSAVIRCQNLDERRKKDAEWVGELQKKADNGDKEAKARLGLIKDEDKLFEAAAKGNAEAANQIDQKIRENLKRISKYYAKWLDLAPTYRLQFTVGDVISVAEVLYMIAKRLNGFGANITSFLDLKGKPCPERQYWLDAAKVHQLLLPRLESKQGSQERIEVALRLAHCFSFVAQTADEWDEAKRQYNEIISSYKLIKDNRIDQQVLNANTKLLTIYLELGYVHYELGKRGQKIDHEMALIVFQNVMGASGNGSEPWWIAKFMYIQVLAKKGGMDDIKDAKLFLDNVKRSNPDFDGNRFGMKDKFLELEKEINASK